MSVGEKESGLVHMVGSPFWMPPEMIQGKAHSNPVDIWSLAVSLIEMIMKKPPNRNSSVKAMYIVASQGLIPHINMLEKKKKISSQLSQFLSGCLNMDPSQRSTATQLLSVGLFILYLCIYNISIKTSVDNINRFIE